MPLYMVLVNQKKNRQKMVCEASAVEGRALKPSKRHFLQMLRVPPASPASIPSCFAVASPGLTPLRTVDWCASMQELPAAVVMIYAYENRVLVLLQDNLYPVSEVFSCWVIPRFGL